MFWWVYGSVSAASRHVRIIAWLLRSGGGGLRGAPGGIVFTPMPLLRIVGDLLCMLNLIVLCMYCGPGGDRLFMCGSVSVGTRPML